MFLVGMRRLCLCAIPLIPFLLSACAFRPDDSWKKAPSSAQCATAPVAVEASESSAAPRSFFGLRRDPGLDAQRAERQARLAGDPVLLPTPREQRAARAMALAELKMIVEGDTVLHRSDGSASRPDAVKFVSTPGGLTLDYAADDALNRFDGIPHALLLVVYHLSDRAALNQLATHEDGLRKLLKGEIFDSSVKSVRKHFVQPGASGTLLLERPEDGRFVALVAGYAEPSSGTSLYVAEYGVAEWLAPGTTKVHNRKKMYTPLPMHLMASLAPEAMSVKNTTRVFAKTFDMHVFTDDQHRRHAIDNFF